MSSIFAALANGGSALRQFERAVTLVQTNVVNANSPGYASQNFQFEAQPFAPDAGLYGGVQTSGIVSSRDEFAESAVRRQASQEGYFTQLSQTLSTVQAAFDVGTPGGLSASMQSL